MEAWDENYSTGETEAGGSWVEHQSRLCGKILSKNKTYIFKLNYYGLLKSGTLSSPELLAAQNMVWIFQTFFKWKVFL